MKFRVSSLLLLLLVVLVPAVQATTYIVPEDRELIGMADAIVIARAGAPVSEPHPYWPVVTRTPLIVEEVLKGSVPDVLDIVEPGGELNGRFFTVTDSASYHEGERVLVFLGRHQGNWHTREMMLGKFNFMQDSRGRELLVRGNGMHDPVGFNKSMERHQEMRRSAAAFAAYIRSIARGEEPAADYFVPMDARLDVEAHRDIEAHATANAFLMQSGSGGFRWQVFDTSGSTTYAPSGEQDGSVDSNVSIDNALGAWSGDPNSAVSASRSGTSAKREPDNIDRVNVVILNYPANGDAWNGNTSAIGLGFVSADAVYSRGGESFVRTIDGDSLMKAGIALSQSQFDELVTHELGHTLGFRHSDQGTPSANTAVMRSILVGSLGANLQAWDAEAVATVYGAGPVCTNPAITSHPQSTSIQEGQQTTLSVAASGTAPTYQWFIGATSGSGTPISGATSSSLTVSPSATTSYWVRVTACSQNVNSNVATVTVSCGPPQITQHPQNRTIQSGGTTSLSVVATGTGPLSYQWYEGNSGDTSKPLGTGSSINVSPAATTSYWVRVTGQCGSPASSNTATVTVSVCEAVAIIGQPQSKTVLANTQFTLDVTHGGSFPFSYQWYRGAKGVTNSPVAGATGVTLRMSVSTTTSFWVRISNCGGSVDSEAATVTVTASCTAPSITTQPQSATIFTGQSATLSVVAGGTNPTFQWFQGTAPNGSAISGATSASLTVSPTATTSYWVRVTACNQTVNSATATVTVSTCPAGKLCVNQRRFELSLAARDQRTGKTAAGVPLQENDLFGFFALPALTGSADNPEVFVKLLDGRVVNQKFWVFYGGLTDLEFTLTVEDKTTGAKKTYKKDPGSVCGGADTGAFELPDDVALTPLEEPVGTDDTVRTFACGAKSLCLLDGRFDVSLAARDQRTGKTGTGAPLPKNKLFGYFALPELTGSTQNPEVFVKVIDGRVVNQKFWVFYGGLTDLEYTLTVKDQTTGAVKTYKKAAGSFCGGADTGAFAKVEWAEE